MLNRTTTSRAGESEHRRDAVDGMRLCGYFPLIAHLVDVDVDVGLGSASRRATDPRIDAVGMHLAAVHSMPLRRVAELVSHAIARRARNGTVTAGRGKRRARARRAHSAVTFTLGQ